MPPVSLTRPPLRTLVIARRFQRRGICFAKLHWINAGPDASRHFLYKKMTAA